ncbi:MAG: arginine repressor [Oscillospiraceae bacterium]|nr:arginine repressor [Oscillospiraceae bacterium]
MKNARQKEIMDIIRQYTVSNQDALQELLKKRGYPVTQATISRDIRELGLIKKADGEGVYHYVMPDRAAPYGDMLIGNVLSADYAGHTLVIKCRSGTAQAVCTVLDEMQRPEIVGTLAGDDTIFALMRTNEQAKRFATELMEMIQGE